MRIITGTLKGRKLKIPANLDLRPTSDRTKEGMFAVIEAHKGFEQMRILDLYAGTGNLGFEALSRGAASVFFIESNRQAVKVIEDNAEKLGLEERISGVCGQVEHLLKGTPARYDIVFADPPYEEEFMPELVDIVTRQWLEPEGWLVLEHDKRRDFTDHPLCVFSKPYGRTIVSIFEPEASHKEAP